MSRLSPAAQAALSLQASSVTTFGNLGHQITVGAQNIVVARVDVKQGLAAPKTALSLVGHKSVRNLIEALEKVEAHMIREEALLDQMMGRAPRQLELA
jgi:hypothetical protein